MKILCIALLFISYSPAIAQSQTWYVAAKAGLSIREKPDVAGKVIDKIPFGTKITLDEPDQNMNKVSTEGFNGFWRKVKYNSKAGFIVDSYLFLLPPPKSTTRNLKEYLAQISSPFGKLLIVKQGHGESDDASRSELKKQLFENGAEWHELQGYESASETYFIPDFTIEQGFLLLRLIKAFPEIIGENDIFLLKSITMKKGETEKKITIEKEDLGHGNFWLKKLKIEFTDAAMYNLELYQIDNQLVIVYNSGV